MGKALFTEIENGRYPVPRIPRQERICKVCTSQDSCVIVKAAVWLFELPWQIFAKSDSCPFLCREIYALPEKQRFQFFFGVLTSQ